MTDSILSGEGLYKHFLLGGQRVKALDGVDVTIHAGEFVVIMGASGSGKSTLLYALTGLDTPSAGNVYIAGRLISSLSETDLAHLRNQLIGFVFQGFYLVPTMTALENVMLPGLFAHHSKTRRYQQAATLLHQLKLGDRLHNRPNQLSGGQQQRVAIARALYNDAPVIVADEPTGALDSKTGTHIMQMLRQLCTQQGKTIVIVTHDPSVTHYADRVIRLRDGRIIQNTRKAETAS